MAPLREAGVTLMETLVVLAIVGLVTAAVAVPLNASWQRSRLEGTAGEIRSFLQLAYTEAINQRTNITVTLTHNGATGNWELHVTPPPAAPRTSLGTYVVPSFVSSIDANPNTNWPVVAGTRTLICDPKGLTLDPTTASPTTGLPMQVTTTQTLAVTHVSMVDGSLTPFVEYDLQLYPLWNASYRKVVR